MKFRFIYNPRSGHNARNPHLWHRAHAFIREHRLDATVVRTERPQHATELARAAMADGCDTVVAIGGDGTMNEVAAALLDTPVNLGLIPCGSGNGLGRHLGIPGPGRGAFRTLLTGQPRVIDTATVNGRPFCNVMGLGFDAEISDRFAHVSRRGLSAYIRTGLTAWRNFQPVPVTVRSSAGVLTETAFIVAVANSDQYGNDCRIAPGAIIDDGLLDLTLIRPVTFFSALPLAVRFFRGRLDGSPRVVRIRAGEFEITRPAAGPVHADGEPFETGAVVAVKVRPRSLRVLVPGHR